MSEATERAKRSFLAFLRGNKDEPSRLWLAAAALVLAMISLRSCTTIEAGMVAVRINNITGSTEVISTRLVPLPSGSSDMRRKAAESHVVRSVDNWTS